MRPDRQHELLRAETAYICDPERRSVEHWHREFLRTLQPLEATQQQAAEARWSERRQAFWRGVQAAWLRQHQVSLLRSRAEELTEALELRSEIYRMIRPRMVDGVAVFPVQPKSFEGLVTAFAKIDQMIESKREAVLGAINPALGRMETESEAAGPHRELPFSGQEMRRLAHELLKARRKKDKSARVELQTGIG